MSNLLIRDAIEDDIPIIVLMYADDRLGVTREKPSTPLPPRYLAAFHELDRDPRHRLVVAELEGEVVATLQLSFLPNLTLIGSERAQIEAVRVKSHLRGEGMGKTLVEWAIEEAWVRGCGAVQLMTDKERKDAHRFYERLGFLPSHVGMKLSL